MTPRLTEIEKKLYHLERIDPGWKTFGADAHKYVNSRIPENKIIEFEKRLGIELPPELREFLLVIGPGAGPDYGIFTLKKMLQEYDEWAYILDENVIDAHDFKKLSRPSNMFELTNADALDLIEKKKNSPKEFFYKRLTTANGILPIQTEGCTYFCFIVLNGEQLGKIWSADLNEFDTLPSGITTEFTFFDWYEDWLDRSISVLTVQ